MTFGKLSDIVSIGGLLITFYYGFRHYVMKKDDYEWEGRDDTDKFIFYLFTSPIWLHPTL